MTVLGLLWDALSRRHPDGDDGEIETDDRLEAYPTSDHLIGLRRVFATIVHVSREATGTTMLVAFIALSGLAVLAAVLPFGAM